MSLPALCSYRQIKYTMHIIILQFHRCGCKIGGRGALVERQTASSVMHTSQVRTLLILRRVIREISLFVHSQCD